MSEEFTCPNCMCQSVIYPKNAADDERVTCRTCGTFLATLPQFRRLIEQRPRRHGIHTSGC